MITRVMNLRTFEMVEWDDTLNMTVAECVRNQCWEGDPITVTTEPGRLNQRPTRNKTRRVDEYSPDFVFMQMNDYPKTWLIMQNRRLRATGPGAQVSGTAPSRYIYADPRMNIHFQHFPDALAD